MTRKKVQKLSKSGGKIGSGSGIRYCYQCIDDYSKTNLDWDSLTQSQILHRRKMQLENHQNHDLYSLGFKFTCKAAPCFGVFTSKEQQSEHELSKKCLRMVYLKANFPNSYTSSIYCLDNFVYENIPKFTNLSAENFLAELPNISNCKFGLSKNQLIERYSSFSNFICAEEVLRRISVKETNDLSIFKVLTFDLYLNKKIAVLQLSIHDNISESLYILQKLKQNNDENEIDLKSRLDVLNDERDEMLDELQDRTNKLSEKIKLYSKSKKGKVIESRKLLDVEFERSHQTISNFYARQGVEIEPIVSQLDPSEFIDTRFRDKTSDSSKKSNTNELNISDNIIDSPIIQSSSSLDQLRPKNKF